MRNFKPKSKIFSKKSIPLILFLLSSLFLTLFLPASVSDQLKLGITLPLVPFQKATTLAINNVTAFFGRLFSFWNLGEENERLKGEVFRLKNHVINQGNIIHKLKGEIESLSDFHDRGIAVGKPIMANIIGYDTLEFKKSVIIDAGNKYGIRVNDVVVSGDALVGRVSSVARFTSRVQLVTDPAIRVPARVVESRDQGIVQGTAGVLCQMEYIPNSAEVKEGDRIVTSTIGGAYPDSIYIGAVTRSRERDGRLFRDIEIRPVVDISRVESVLVIRQRRMEERD